MELVVVNGASNVAKRVVHSMLRQGQYRKVRLLDFKPYHQHVYDFQREIASHGVQVEKVLTANGASLDLGLEGAENVVYFTHNYTSMCPDKNDFLVGTAKLTKKHGIRNAVAVLPVEHDLAYTDHATKSWVEVRTDAEQQARSINPNMSLLSTSLVFADGPTGLIHYMA
jgi:hypothetical protein